MSESIYFFDDFQQLIKIVGTDRIEESVQEKTITKEKDELMNNTLSATVKYDPDIADAAYIAVKEPDNYFSMYRIHTDSDKGNLLPFTGVDAGPDELDNYVVIDIRPKNQAVKTVAERLISFTDGEWRVGYVDPLIPAVTTTFYYVSVREALKALQTVGCEILFKYTVTGTGIKDKWIEIYKKIGKTSNRRFEYGSSALEVVRERDRSQVYTSYIGRGKGEEVGDGYGRRIEFKDVEWKTSAGKPVDKPKGQIFVEIPAMTKKYGIPTKNGKMRKREKVVIFEDEEDPANLLQLTYAALEENSRPLVQFKTSILGGDEIGDTVTIHRYDRNYHYRTRIYKVKIDRLTGSVTAELGDQLVNSASKKMSNTQNQLQTLDAKKMTFYQSTEVSKWQSDIIRGAHGGSILLMNPEDAGTGPSRQPYQQVFMNGDSIETSDEFLVMNARGIGFIAGDFKEDEFKTAWTIDGNFNANYIQSGKIRADIFETSFNAVGDQLKLVGGALQAWKNKKKFMELTKNGLEFWGENKKTIGVMGVVTEENNPFPGYAYEEPYNNMFLRSFKRDIIISTDKDQGMVVLKDGKVIIYNSADIYTGQGNDHALNIYGDVNIGGNGSLFIGGKQVYPGQGGGGSGSEGGQGNNWSGEYPPEVTSQRDKYAWVLWVILLAKGYSKQAIAGILGNVEGEVGSSMNPDTAQSGGAAPGYGIVQWDGSAYPLVGSPTSNGRVYVQRLMNKAGIKEDYKTMEAQAKLVDWSMYHGQWGGAVSPTTVAGFKAIKDASNAAYVFEKNFERPEDAHPERQGWAVAWYNKFKDLKIPQANKDIISIAKSWLGWFKYGQVHPSSDLGNLSNPNKNGTTDCSGFIWLVLNKAGYKVPGNMQWYTGSMTSDARGSHRWLKEISGGSSRAGDIVIYNQGSGAGNNGHTAFLLEKYHGNNTQIIEMGGDSRKSGVNISTIGYAFGYLLSGDRCIARAIK